MGQTVHAHFHFTPRDGAYASLSYFTPGKFSNTVFAPAKAPSTSPSVLRYINNAELRFRHVSLGWKRYFMGNTAIEKGWNIFGVAGFGLMLGSVTNIHSRPVPDSLYHIPVRSGKANFKRLTLDLGLGIEKPVGGDIFLYFEGRMLVPTTDYPSPYLFVNDNAPLTASANLGLRILFH